MEQATIGDNDKSALLDILTWLFLVCGVLGVLTQTVTKLVIRRSLGPQDYLILPSLAFAIAQSACVGIQISHGLGKHIDSLTVKQQETIFKAEYASHMLFMVSLCLTKLSLVIFITNLTIVKLYHYASWALGLFIVLWTVSSMFAIAFQCRTPQPWIYTDNTCFDRKTFWNAYGIFNIITDIAPVVWMIVVASRLQTSLNRKLTVAGVFSSRFIVVAAVACQLYYMNRAMPTTDPTFDLWPNWVCTQLVQSLAIITACVPYLKPFMDSLESGGFRADDQRRRTTKGYGSYNNINKYGSSSKGKSPGGGERGRRRDSVHELGVVTLRRNSARGVHGAKAEGRAGSDWDDDYEGDDGNSQSSQARIIKETRTFTINVETREPGNHG